MDASPIKEILDNLKEQLKGDAKDAQATVQKLMKQALGHIGDDVKALLVDPKGASDIIHKNWQNDFNQFVNEGQNYVATVQQHMQDAFDVSIS